MGAKFTSRGLLLAAVLAIACLPVQAQWKWRDARGQLQYSDRPPPSGTPERDILQRPNAANLPRTEPLVEAASAPAPAAAASAVDPALEAKRKQAEQEEQAKRKAEEERNLQAKAQNCARARSAMRTLESGQRMVRINDKGEREVIDDTVRAAEMQQARQVATENCS